MELAYAVMEQLWRAFKELDIWGEIDAAMWDEVAIATLMQHSQHLGVHGISQSNLDPYKYCCWFGCAVLERVALIDGDKDERCNFAKFSQALVGTLCGMLLRDSNGTARVPDHTIQLLRQMLREQKKHNDKHGLWQNGLYAAFHTAVAVGNWNSD